MCHSRQKPQNIVLQILISNQPSELVTLWEKLTVDQQQSVLELTPVLVSKNHQCDQDQAN